VLVFFERVTGVENVFVRERDRGDVLDARSIPATSSPAESFVSSSTFADEVFPHSSPFQTARTFCTRLTSERSMSGRVWYFRRAGSPTSILSGSTFSRPDAVVLGVVFEPVFFECHRGTRSGVAVFAGSRVDSPRQTCVVQVEPRLESVRKFFDDFLDWIARSSLSSTTGSSYNNFRTPSSGFLRLHPRFRPAVQRATFQIFEAESLSESRPSGHLRRWFWIEPT